MPAKLGTNLKADSVDYFKNFFSGDGTSENIFFAGVLACDAGIRNGVAGDACQDYHKVQGG